MKSRERRQLIDSLFDGDITEADFLILEAELSMDSNFRQEYFDRISLEMLLETEARTEEGAAGEWPSAAKSRLPLSSWTTPWRQALLSFGSIAAAILLMLVWQQATGDRLAPATSPPVNAMSTEEGAIGYAVIIGQDDVAWEDSRVLANGSLLPTGDLRLSSGIVQLELFSGVSVVIEGPAAFSVTSPMQMDVGSGKVRAHVPEPAHGFRLSTRDGDIIDLGTDFAVDVTGDRSELHVLEGEVEFLSKGKSPQRFETGQALRMSSDGGQADITADDQRFVGQREIVGRLQRTQKTKREQWLKWSEQRRDDPRMVALYQVSASEKSDRRLENRITSRTGASEGAIVAAARTADRWRHGGGALDFSPTGSRVRLTIPGNYQSLTLLCWVKIHSLDRWYNSLFLTDGHEKHEPHWQIMDDGRLFFSVKKRDTWDASKGEKDKHVFYSPPFWTAALSGQWLMISTVYDVDARTVTHYVNGEILSEENIPAEYLVEQVKIGSASLGNWGLPERNDPQFAVRNLNGSMDEFALLDVALSAQEIRSLYDNGKP